MAFNNVKFLRCQVLQILKDDLLYNDKEDENEKRLTLREQLMQQGKI